MLRAVYKSCARSPASVMTGLSKGKFWLRKVLGIGIEHIKIMRGQPVVDEGDECAEQQLEEKVLSKDGRFEPGNV